MFWFNENNRQRVLKALRKIVSDEETFEYLFKRFLERRINISKRDVKDSVSKSIENKELSKVLLKVRHMVSEDNQLLHLVIQLRKKGVMVFSDEQQKHFSEIISIVKDLLATSSKLEEFFRYLNRKYAGNPYGPERFRIIPHLKEIEGIDTILEQYKTRIKILIESERKGIEEIEKDLRKGAGFSEEKLFEISDGSIRIEVHSKFTRFKYENPDDVQTFPVGILVFDHDLLVAEIALKEFDGKSMVAHVTETHIKGQGYVQRVIEILLKKRIINEWYSDKITMLSKDAIKMYQRLAKNTYFIIDTIEDRFRVRLVS